MSDVDCSADTFLEKAATEIRRERLVAFATETFFGLAADPFSKVAVAELLALKGRGIEEGIPLLIDSELRVGELLAEETARQRRVREKLQSAFWPGPLTLVIQANNETRERLAPGVAAADGSLAIRLSSHRQATSLAEMTCGALTATSANPRGEAPPVSAEEVAGYFPEVFVLPGLSGASQGAELPSSIVDIRAEQLVLLRTGCVSEADIKDILA